MNEAKYVNDQMEDAKRLAAALVSVPDGKRPMFSLMVEAMLIGAELITKQAAGSGNAQN